MLRNEVTVVLVMIFFVMIGLLSSFKGGKVNGQSISEVGFGHISRP